MKKKVLIIAVVFATILSLLFLIAGKEGEGGGKEPKGPVTLSVLTMTGPFISGPIKAHNPEWSAKHDGKYNVEAIEVAFGDIFPKAKQAAMTKSDAFDMLLAANIWMADFVGFDYVIPLDDYLADTDWYPSDVPEGIVKKNTFHGTTYGLIADNDNQYLFYRKDILGNKCRNLMRADVHISTGGKLLAVAVEGARQITWEDYIGEDEDNEGS